MTRERRRCSSGNQSTESDPCRAGALGIGGFLAGCRVGPHYHAPDAARASPLPTTRNRRSISRMQEGWKVASPQDAMLRGKWWEIFNEPELNALEDQLNINNQNIKVVFRKLHGGACTGRARPAAQYWPTITLGPSWNRSQSPPAIWRNSIAGQHRRHHRPLVVAARRSPGLPISGARFATRCAQRNTRPGQRSRSGTEKLTEQASLAAVLL